MVSIAPIEPIDQPELPKPTPPRRRSLGPEALFGLVVAVLVSALGAPVGLLWSWVAPKVELVQTPYGPYPVEGEPEGYFADDGWFMIIGAGVGVLVAVAAWVLLRRHRGPFILAGLVVGSAAAAALAAWLGNKIGYAHYLDLVQNAPVDTHIFRPAKVRAGEASLWHGFVPWVRGSLLIQALVAAVVYTCLAGFHGSPTLAYEPEPADGYPYPGHQYGDPAQGYAEHGYPQPVFGPPPADGRPGYGPQPWPGQAGETAPGFPGQAQPGYGGFGDQAYGPPANGQPYGEPPPGGPDLRKPASGPPQSAVPDPGHEDRPAP